MNDRQQALLDAARPLPIDLIIDLAGVCRKPGETDVELRARVQDGVRPIPMAIHTIQDAIAATEQGLASCYGRDEQGGDWVGFGRPRRTGHIPRVYLPASAAAVERCQHVQRRYLRFLEREAEPVVIHPGVSPGDVSAEPEVVRPANDAEHDGGDGPRGASAATVEAEIRRACAALAVGLLTFEDWQRHLYSWRVTINGKRYDSPHGAWTDVHLRASQIAMMLRRDERRKATARACGLCLGLSSSLCPVCPRCGGVGS